jgi:peptidoglycan hydrolase CwlO-like protein
METTQRDMAALHPLFASLRGTVESSRVMLNRNLNELLGVNHRAVLEQVDAQADNIVSFLENMMVVVGGIAINTDILPDLEIETRDMKETVDSLDTSVHILRDQSGDIWRKVDSTARRISTLEQHVMAVSVLVKRVEKTMEEQLQLDRAVENSLLRKYHRMEEMLRERDATIQATDRKLARIEEGMKRWTDAMAQLAQNGGSLTGLPSIQASAPTVNPAANVEASRSSAPALADGPPVVVATTAAASRARGKGRAVKQEPVDQETATAVPPRPARKARR